MKNPRNDEIDLNFFILGARINNQVFVFLSKSKYIFIPDDDNLSKRVP